MWVNFLFIKPMILFTLFTVLSICSSNFRFLLNIIPRSDSESTVSSMWVLFLLSGISYSHLNSTLPYETTLHFLMLSLTTSLYSTKKVFLCLPVTLFDLLQMLYYCTTCSHLQIIYRHFLQLPVSHWYKLWTEPVQEWTLVEYLIVPLSNLKRYR